MLGYRKLYSGLILIQIALAYSTTFKTITPSARALRLSFDPACSGKEAGKFVRDPYSCDKFYYCGPNETAIVVDCPHGMIFNDEKEICDLPTNYLCVPRISGEEEGVSTTSSSTEKENAGSSSTTKSETLSTVSNAITKLTTTSTTMTTTTTSASSATTTTTSLVENERACPLNDAKTLTFLRHPHECNRYYICYHGVAIAQECISELHWNAQTNRCDFPENAGCFAPTVAPFQSTKAVSEATGAMLISCPFRGEQIYAHPVNCNYFIYCINGYATVQQCPFYHHFDVRSRRCLWQTVATCMIRKNYS